MLTGLSTAGFAVTARGRCAPSGQQHRRIGTNALASSIVLVCRPRPADARHDRREFVAALRSELPEALRKLQHGNIAPVDLAQAAIGPGMAIFSRYAKVVEADGSADDGADSARPHQPGARRDPRRAGGRLRSRHAFAVAWFEQRGRRRARTARRTFSLAPRTRPSTGCERRAFCVSRAGKVRLLSRDELDPTGTLRPIAPHGLGGHPALVKRLDEDGESCRAELLRRVGATARRRGSSRIASTPSASGRAGRRRRSATTHSSSPGPRSRGSQRGAASRRSRALGV